MIGLTIGRLVDAFCAKTALQCCSHTVIREQYGTVLFAALCAVLCRTSRRNLLL